MMISKVQPPKLSTHLARIAGIAAAAVCLNSVAPQRGFAYNPPADIFERSDSLITPKGLSLFDYWEISSPSPVINIAGEDVNASVVVDLNKNILYYYDYDGNPMKAYRIASGKKSTPTHTCVKRITHFEKYPYSEAPVNSKRRNNPRAYGPKLIAMEIVDTKTGRSLGMNGEFIHGNNDPSSIGKYVSLGCIRMDNQAVQELIMQLKVGDYVVFKR